MRAALQNCRWLKRFENGFTSSIFFILLSAAIGTPRNSRQISMHILEKRHVRFETSSGIRRGSDCGYDDCQSSQSLPRRMSLLNLRGGFDTLGYDDGFRQGSPSRMAVKRIQAELSALEQDPSPFFRARPLNDILDWHFVMLGANNTAYEGGFYHGQILLDQDYPMKPPRIIFLTESGRFEVGVPICLSITSHHRETWQPSWDIRLLMTALQV
jgi:ubiquitin-protein ligase